MRIKNIELVGIMNVLEGYSSKTLPQKINYAITRNIIKLNKDVECYSKSLNKIIENYKDYIIRDEKGKIKYNNQGMPAVDAEHVCSYQDEINELLNIEIDIDLYTIDIDAFDYDDERYDILTAVDIIRLQRILCANGIDESHG